MHEKYLCIITFVTTLADINYLENWREEYTKLDNTRNLPRYFFVYSQFITFNILYIIQINFGVLIW